MCVVWLTNPHYLYACRKCIDSFLAENTYLLHFPHKPFKHEPRYPVTSHTSALWWTSWIGGHMLFTSKPFQQVFVFWGLSLLLFGYQHFCLYFVEMWMFSFFKYLKSHIKMLLCEDFKSCVGIALNTSTPRQAGPSLATCTKWYLFREHLLCNALIWEVNPKPLLDWN